MRLRCVIAGVALAGLAALAHADGAAPAAVTASAGGPRLQGRWGLGYDDIPGASTTSNLIPGLAQANALAVRYWVSDDLAWDGLLALDLNSQPQNGGSANVDQRGYGLGTVLKLNVRRPTPWLLAQLLGRASLAQLQQSNVQGANASQTTNTLAVAVGAGFEAFFPLWDSLSVEGNVNLGFSSTQVKVDGVSGATQNGSSLSIAGNGFSPVNVSIHLYF